MKHLFNRLLNFFFPEKLKCIFCGRDVPNFDEIPFCKDCKKEEFFNNSQHRCKCCDMEILGESEYCDYCKKDHKYFDKATAPFIYEGKVRSALLKMKSNNALYLIEPMGKLMAKRLKEEKFEFDIIIPVPLSEKSFKKRRFNQSELLANQIGKYFNIPVRSDILSKIKETKVQKKLNFTDRQNNLKGVFHVQNWKEIQDKKVLLVDDILTTCATASQCAKILKKHASTVYVVAFARRTLK